MLKNTAAALLALSVCLPLAQAGAEDLKITAEVRYFCPDLDFKYTHSSVKVYQGEPLNSPISHTLDFADNLGTEADNGPEIRIGIGKNWQISYMKIDSHGRQVPNQWFDWHGSAYRGTTESDVDMSYLRLAYRQPWIDNERMNAYWLVDVKDVKLEAKAHDILSGRMEHRKEHQAMPTLGAGIDAAIDKTERWRGNAEVSYLPAGSYGQSYDIEAGISYAVDDQFAVSLGYRVIRIKADKDDEGVDFRLKGPYFGIRGSF